VGIEIDAIGPDQWGLPTPCAGWSIRHLVIHLIEGSHMAERMLDGASAEEARTVFGAVHDDPASEYPARFGAEAAGFAANESDRIVHHPGAGDIPVATFFGMRLTDYVLHTWDLGRALGRDEILPEHLVEAAWESLQPFTPFIAQIGAFGEGPSGAVGDDAPLQLRLLDLSGRRP